jgi:hypothetical protein
MEASTEISKEALGATQCGARSESLQVAPDSEKIKLKLHWRSQDIGDAKKTECLPRKIADNSETGLTVSGRSANSETIATGLPKSIGAHIPILCVCNAGHRAIGFNVCPDLVLVLIYSNPYFASSYFSLLE